ncbi:MULTISPECIES: secretin N-terminal domain-containing protein [unclassified Wenzhouxiangella]|uniref:secretin N-terminal domain-containing protein n=1 Tax=unclassified Wenzhouxiangella TaxID=2613841 RepID=UPI000E326B70|nr:MULTISPECIES: secretin N-terminal domain-containing protein [unclassified Wenzhouxiangella]RFF28788.1 type II secretion system protein GspD [Wenzhouxiangella sp. 15181]RFP67808.1 type II secretion system protein GspD [Wenzhouxiangella sp. 15190]
MMRSIRLAAVLLALSLPALAQDAAEDNGHVLNFKDADIRALITTVADMTGRSIIVDPQVSGQVTVISSQSLDDEEVWQVFQSILRVHGYAAVGDDETVRVVPDVNARQDGRVPVDDMRGGGDEPVTRIIKLEHVDAGEVSQLLRQLLPQSAYMVHHESSNSLIVSDRATNIRRIETIIERLDAAIDQEVEVIALSHADAADVVQLINQIYPANGGAQSAVADQRSNTVVLSGDPARRLRLRTLISHLDTPLESEGSTRVIYLRYATADTLVPVLEGMLELDSEEGAKARIQAHGETNALVVTAPPSTFRSIESVVDQLDVRRAQVLVEAIIAEVAVDTSRELGIQWQAFESGDSGFFGGTNFESGGNNIINLSAGLGSGENGNMLLPGRGLNLGYVGGTTSLLGMELLEIGGLARALASDSNTNVLSTPSIVTLDNHEASINVGQEVPFLSGSFSSQGLSTSEGQVNPFQTINREEIGVKLNVTPHINEGDAVMLNISQEVSTLAPSTGAVDLITDKRTISTRVMVPDGSILVLGGLMSDDLQEGREEVPGLGRIPLLGELFRYRTSSKVKRNLMVFIRPQILHDEALMDSITRSKYTRIRDLQLDQRESVDGLGRKEQMPLLPELEAFMQAAPETPSGSGQSGDSSRDDQ